MKKTERSITADLTRCRMDPIVRKAATAASTVARTAAKTVDHRESGPANRARARVLVERPWGTFEQFCCNEEVTVKLITVRPGQRLSLQRHVNRTEWWQVLDGPVDVTVGSRTWSAEPGECVWVPQGETHRLGNQHQAPGRVLEIAFGHFDEDDIERLEDDYSRDRD